MGYRSGMQKYNQGFKSQIQALSHSFVVTSTGLSVAVAHNSVFSSLLHSKEVDKAIIAKAEFQKV